MYRLFTFIFCIIIALSSCSNDDNAIDNRPLLTLITSTGGMGDNGYNDLILDGIMEFVTRNDVDLSIVSPKDRQKTKKHCFIRNASKKYLSTFYRISE
jgi:basic membrane lipoprotein Med (substrate-binding protein (PBP1-ABC) superfamily)